MTVSRRPTRWPGRTFGRAIGVLVLVLIVAVLLLPHLRLGEATGTPVVSPVPPPPVVGDCLNTPLPASFNVNSSAQGADSFSQLSLGACRSGHYGEVTAMTDSTGGGTPSTAPGTAGTRIGDFCTAAAHTYLGVDSAARIGPWDPQTTSGSLVLAPSPRQQAAGQDWLACLVYSPTTDASTGSASARLDAPLRGAYLSGANATLIGVCPTDEKWRGGLPGGCAAPHRVEVFGLGNFSETSLPRVDLEQTCGQWVRSVTGLTDPTAAAALAVRVVATDPDGALITTAEIPASSYTVCGVAVQGPRRLGGSLIAVGSRPLPWV